MENIVKDSNVKGRVLKIEKIKNRLTEEEKKIRVEAELNAITKLGEIVSNFSSIDTPKVI